MPPRTSTTLVGGVLNLAGLYQALPVTASLPPVSTSCATYLFSTSASQLSIKKKRKARKHLDPYRAAQAKQRKIINLQRQDRLTAERRAALGDAVRSRPTSFINSLRSPQAYHQDKEGSQDQTTRSPQYHNFFLNSSDLSKQLAHSKWLTEPVPLDELEGAQTQVKDPQSEKLRYDDYTNRHNNADQALQSITALQHGNSKDRTRLNIQRCIEEFGRHKTDAYLPPKPASLGQSTGMHQSTQLSRPALSEEDLAIRAELDTIPKRVGADTGSSEVQIAILTTKINVMAENVRNKDKHNKRNLRILVHKRQKLLNYLRKKERGGPRWQNIVDKLGINDAMWKGEISL